MTSKEFQAIFHILYSHMSDPNANSHSTLPSELSDADLKKALRDHDNIIRNLRQDVNKINERNNQNEKFFHDAIK